MGKELLFWPIRMWPYKFLFSNIRFTSVLYVHRYLLCYRCRLDLGYCLTTLPLDGLMDTSISITLIHERCDSPSSSSLTGWVMLLWLQWDILMIRIAFSTTVGVFSRRVLIANTSLTQDLVIINFKWTLMLAIFLGGLSLHVSSALLAHMAEINMTWGPTAKVAEFSNFFIEVPKALRKFKFSMLFALIGILGMIVLSEGSFVLPDWQIKDFVAILPMSTVTVSHMLFAHFS